MDYSAEEKSMLLSLLHKGYCVVDITKDHIQIALPRPCPDEKLKLYHHLGENMYKLSSEKQVLKWKCNTCNVVCFWCKICGFCKDNRISEMHQGLPNARIDKRIFG